jgi:ribose 5-phosphate isomerase B
MKIIVASDHGGFPFKAEIIKHLTSMGHQITDGGTFNEGSCHYPTYAFFAAEKVRDGLVDRGVLLCSTGIGISIAANKVKGVRCAVGYSDEVVNLTRKDNDANMIAFGAKFMELKDIIRRIDIFLAVNHEGGRHQTRVDLITDYEQTHYCK